MCSDIIVLVILICIMSNNLVEILNRIEARSYKGNFHIDSQK
jgi:hypothetical protein